MSQVELILLIFELEEEQQKMDWGRKGLVVVFSQCYTTCAKGIINFVLFLFDGTYYLTDTSFCIIGN